MAPHVRPLTELITALCNASDITTAAVIQAMHNEGETLPDKLTKSVCTRLEEKLAVLQANIWAVQTHLKLEKRTRLVIDTMKQLRKSVE
jgi:uncharacterized protein YdaL